MILCLIKKKLGNLGEEIASKYLINKGYLIIQKNFRTKFGEIDIIARDGRYLVFIEVKLRKSLNLGYPREAVDYYKQQRIRNLANLYLAKKRIKDAFIRFDVVEIMLDENENVKSIYLIQNAFE